MFKCYVEIVSGEEREDGTGLKPGWVAIKGWLTADAIVERQPHKAGFFESAEHVQVVLNYLIYRRPLSADLQQFSTTITTVNNLDRQQHRLAFQRAVEIANEVYEKDVEAQKAAQERGDADPLYWDPTGFQKALVKIGSDWGFDPMDIDKAMKDQWSREVSTESK
jgi:hypothetical protein